LAGRFARVEAIIKLVEVVGGVFCFVVFARYLESAIHLSSALSLVALGARFVMLRQHRAEGLRAIAMLYGVVFAATGILAVAMHFLVVTLGSTVATDLGAGLLTSLALGVLGVFVARRLRATITT
ncbi:MAG: hypothetical protein KC416_09435, partial [Myxococcales bacterium]|nr:hypothetical protein [Myxococcales bacterium]